MKKVYKFTVPIYIAIEDTKRSDVGVTMALLLRGAEREHGIHVDFNKLKNKGEVIGNEIPEELK